PSRSGLFKLKPSAYRPPSRRCARPRAFVSAQACRVVGHGCDVAVGHAIGGFEHFGAVGTVAIAEQAQLLGNVVGVLTGNTRVLAGDACAVGRVAARTGRHATRSNATAPDRQTTFHGRFVAGRSGGFGVERLYRQIVREVADIFVGEGSGHG